MRVQNGLIPSQISNQFVKSPKSDEKVLPIMILLDKLAENQESHKNQKQASSLPADKRFDVFEAVIARDMKRAGKDVEYDEDGLLIVHNVCQGDVHKIPPEVERDYSEVEVSI
jgi:hypothetical protein